MIDDCPAKQEKDDSAVYAIMCWVGLTLITAPTVQSWKILLLFCKRPASKINYRKLWIKNLKKKKIQSARKQVRKTKNSNGGTEQIVRRESQEKKKDKV